MLYLIATPIGNLQDWSLRAVEVLRSCNYILCEDTRHSQRLLQAYDIQKPLISYHKFNETKKLHKVLNDLKSGSDIALISDAGTPIIADPGNRLVKECISLGIDISAVPGPCAAIVALTLSGFEPSRFQFLGFLPRKKNERHRTLIDILNYPGTTICYESPKRIISILKIIHELAPQVRICIARELTKKFEELLRGTAKEVLDQWQQRTPKGEIVLLIEENPTKIKQWNELSPQEHVTMIEELYHISHHEAIKLVAEIRALPKREVYRQTTH